jgi:hypothetical protein
MTRTRNPDEKMSRLIDCGWGNFDREGLSWFGREQDRNPGGCE